MMTFCSAWMARHISCLSPEGDIHLVAQAAQFEAILETGGSAVIARRQYVLVPHGYRPHMVAQASGTLRDNRRQP